MPHTKPERVVSRRSFFKRSAAFAISSTAAGAILTACGAQNVPTPTAASAGGARPTGGTQSSANAVPTSAVVVTAVASSQGARPTLSAPEGRSSTAATGADAVLNFGAIQEPDTLDPHLSTSVSDTMLMNIYEKLVDVDVRTGQVVAQLATDWSVSPDGLTYTFKLRDGVLFHDGTPFDADAAIVNFKRCIALKAYIPDAFTAIDTMTATDRLTLTIKLKNILNPFVAMLSKNPKMISPTAIQQHTQGDDNAKTWLAANTAGTGPYMHTRWDHGSNLVWEAFPKYWRGFDGRHVTTVNNRIILEPGTQRLKVEAGDLDVAMNYTQDSLPALRKNLALNVVGVDQPNILYIRFNNFVGPMKDVRVRKALSYAFDYNAYTALLGYDRPRSDMPVPTQLFGPGYTPVKIPYFTFDSDMAKQLLQESGYANGFTMNLFHEPGTPQKDTLGEYFQAAMSQIKVKVNLMIEPFTNILSRAADQKTQQNYDTAIHSYILYTPPPYPDPSGVLLRMYQPYPAGIRNIIGYNNPEVTRLVTDGVKNPDLAAAAKMYWQANLLIAEDCPDLILDRSVQFEILRTNVMGHAPAVLEPWRWNYWDIWKQS